MEATEFVDVMQREKNRVLGGSINGRFTALLGIMQAAEAAVSKK